MLSEDRDVLHIYHVLSTSCYVKHLNFVKIRGVLHIYHELSNKPNLVASALKGASDWKLLVVDHDQVVFPPEILSTNERPDIVIWSIKLQKVILIELTCCAEEGISSAQLRKEK